MSLSQRRQQRLSGLIRATRPEPVRVVSAPPPAPTAGPGTELRKLLHTVGIEPKGPNCECNAHAREMDEHGPDWCEAHLETIVDWLAAEAKKRPIVGALFSRVAARAVVRLAIARARKAQA